MSLLSKLS